MAILEYNDYLKKNYGTLWDIHLVNIADQTTSALKQVFKALMKQQKSDSVCGISAMTYREDQNKDPDRVGIPAKITGKRRVDKGKGADGMTDNASWQMSDSWKELPVKPGRMFLQTEEAVHIDIYTGNLVKQQTEVLVNAANGALMHEGGLAKAIADAAGQELLRESNDYVAKFGEVPVSQVMHTTAGKIQPPVKHVIHAVGPFWNEQDPGGSFRDIQATFLNVLVYANEKLKARSISIPAISSGLILLCVRF